MTWVDRAGRLAASAVHNLPYGVFSTGRRAGRASACAIGDHVLDLAAVAARRRTWHRAGVRAPLAQRVPRARAPRLDAVAGLAHRAADRRRRTASVGRAAPGPARDVDAAPAVRGRRLRRLLRLASTTPTNVGRIFRPGRRAADRRTGSTCRSATTAAPARSSSRGTDVVRPSGQRKAPTDAGADRSARRYGSTSRPRSASSSAAPSALGEPVPRRRASPTTSSASCWSTTGPPATSRPGSTCRSARSSASRSPPRSRRGWCRSTRSSRRGSPPPAQDPEPLPYLRDEPSDPCGLDLHLEVRLERHGRLAAAVRRHVLDAGPAARAPDRQRRLAAHRRPVRLRHGLPGRSRDQRGSLPRAHLERHRAGHASPTARPRTFLEDGDTVTISGWAPGADGVRIGLGEVTGTVRSARR